MTYVSYGFISKENQKMIIEKVLPNFEGWIASDFHRALDYMKTIVFESSTIAFPKSLDDIKDED